jgi:integrase
VRRIGSRTDAERPIQTTPMGSAAARIPTGHVFRREGKRGSAWYAKYRLPDGRQVQKRLGPAWTERGRPAAGYFTKRTAEGWLRDLLDEARRGTLPGMVRTGATFADAAAEWLRYVEHERACKHSTLRDYRIMVGRLNRDFGTKPVEDITRDELERWKSTLIAERMANRTLQKYLIVLNGIFKRAIRVWNLPTNPAANVERPRLPRGGNIDVLSGEEVMALVRAADSEQDAAIFLTAAFTGLRQGELLALRWRDVDFGLDLIRVRRNYTQGHEGTPKSGRERAVPMMREVAEALARLSQRERFTGPEDLVFCSDLGGHRSDKRLLARYYKALERAGLRRLRFHDLRHTFGTHAIRVADPREVMEWMGHADLKTTQIYLQFKPKADAARRLSEAFGPERQPDAVA